MAMSLRFAIIFTSLLGGVPSWAQQLAVPTYQSMRAQQQQSGPSWIDLYNQAKQKEASGAKLSTNEKAIILNNSRLGGELLEIGAGTPTYWYFDQAGH